MTKCAICNGKIETTFLDKIVGAYVKDDKGKKHSVCFECQKKFQTKDEVLKKLKK
jgi:uncharacterized protein with PIN domain